MADRAQLLGGTFAAGRHGDGFCVEVSIPTGGARDVGDKPVLPRWTGTATRPDTGQLGSLQPGTAEPAR